MSAAADHKPGECGPAAEHPSDVLKAVLTRLHAAGYWLLPLGAGEDGRKPSLSFSTSDGRPTGRHPLELTIRRMAAVGTSNYAIRLMNLLVVDVDTDTQEAHAYVERWFGSSRCRSRPAKASITGIASKARNPHPSDSQTSSSTSRRAFRISPPDHLPNEPMASAICRKAVGSKQLTTCPSLSTAARPQLQRGNSPPRREGRHGLPQ